MPYRISNNGEIIFIYANDVNSKEALAQEDAWYYGKVTNTPQRWQTNGTWYRTFYSRYRSYLSLKSKGFRGGKIWEYNSQMDTLRGMEINLANWEAKRRIEIPLEIEEKRLQDIEDKRLQDIEEKRLQDIEDKRLQDIENKRLIQLSNDTLLLEEVRSNPNIQVSDERLLQLLIQEKNQSITFNEQKNSGDFNETPITDINFIDGCSGCDVDTRLIINETRNNVNVTPTTKFFDHTKNTENNIKINQ